jgi:hypothetical protein
LDRHGLAYCFYRARIRPGGAFPLFVGKEKAVDADILAVKPV